MFISYHNLSGYAYFNHLYQGNIKLFLFLKKSVDNHQFIAYNVWAMARWRNG